MFVTLFAFILATAYAAEELPAYIHACGRNDPNYGQCILDNINNMKSMICTGMPELDVLPTEPVVVDKIAIYNTDNLKLSIQDLKIAGYCDVEIKSLDISPDKLQLDIYCIFKHLNVDSVYDFDIHVLVSLANIGLIHLSTDNVEGKITLNLKEVTKNGKKQIYASKANTILNIETFNYEFNDSEKDLVQLHEALKNTISENEKDIINKVTPSIEEAVSKLVILITNNISNNRFEQLFPDEAP